MTLELKPLGNSCNLDCIYCYQEPMRKAGNVRTINKYDIDLIIDMAEKRAEANKYYKSEGFTLFGGEALLVPIKDLEKLFARSFELYGKSSVQSNGSLITDKHIEMFKKYNVSVGISIDGPNDLNSLRCSASAKKSTDDLTQATMTNISKLCAEGIGLGIIITIHRLNATPEKLPRLKNFIRWLGDTGVKDGNIHLLEVDSEIVRNNYTLTVKENIAAMKDLATFFNENKDLRYSPFTEYKDMLSGNKQSSCIFSHCDPMNTQAVYGIEGDGQISNCGMVNKEGIEWTKAKDENYLRDLVLYQTPQDKEGCKGCRFFMFCNGYCPGSAEKGDWRNKTEHCATLKAMFSHFEKELEDEGITPISKDPLREKFEEELVYNQLAYGVRYGLEYTYDVVRQREIPDYKAEGHIDSNECCTSGCTCE